MVHKTPATTTPTRRSRLGTPGVISRNIAKYSAKFSASETTTPTTATATLWPRPPVTSPEASVATTNSTPSETSSASPRRRALRKVGRALYGTAQRSEEHTSELQSLRHLVCRLL